MIDQNCDVEVGIHPGPFWYDPYRDLQVCSRHKSHYEERHDEFGPYRWEKGTRQLYEKNQNLILKTFDGETAQDPVKRVWDGPRRKIGIFKDDHWLVQIGWWLEPEAMFVPIMKKINITGSASPVYVEDSND